MRQITIPDELLFKYGAKVRNFEKDDYLAKAGSYPKSILYIKSGTAKIVNFNEDGTEVLHGFNSANHLIGIGTYLGNLKYYNDFIALSEVETRELSLEQFELLMSENFEVTREIMRYLSIIVNLKTTTLSATLGNSPREKVLFLLDAVKPYMDKAGLDRLPYTRQDMANYLGLRVETVIRTIKELEGEGKIELDKGKICI